MRALLARVFLVSSSFTVFCALLAWSTRTPARSCTLSRVLIWRSSLQLRAFEFVPYFPTGQLVGRRAFRKDLAGVIDAPITFLWDIEKWP